MFCHQARKLIIKQQSEALSPQQDAALTRHLRACDACREEEATLRSMVPRLASIPPEQPLSALPSARIEAIWDACRPAATVASSNR